MAYEKNEIANEISAVKYSLDNLDVDLRLVIDGLNKQNENLEGIGSSCYDISLKNKDKEASDYTLKYLDAKLAYLEKKITTTAYQEYLITLAKFNKDEKLNKEIQLEYNNVFNEVRKNK